jgi:hypothetical protein
MIVNGKHLVLTTPCPTCGNRQPDLVRNNAEPVDSELLTFECQADRGDGMPCATTWSPSTGERVSLPSDTVWCFPHELPGGTAAEQRALLEEVRATLKDFEKLEADGLVHKQWILGSGWHYDLTDLGRSVADHAEPSSGTTQESD